ncbi:hypothetical protein N7454_002334 [Penicillium verhagenii]|nr:hypothetical protein N7454_002334 [Penicillium verhagenii]
MDKEDARANYPSYAAIKLSCSSVDNPTLHAMIQVYFQIPHTYTELKDSDIRAKQAMEFKPQGLKAFQILSENSATSSFTPSLLCYHEFKQDTSGLVPNGFITFIAWEMLPEIPPGSEIEAEHFCASNMAWDSETKTL